MPRPKSKTEHVRLTVSLMRATRNKVDLMAAQYGASCSQIVQFAIIEYYDQHYRSPARKGERTLRS